MNDLRYKELILGIVRLTQDEKDEGWHFCPDWDFLLIGPNSPEMESCTKRKGILNDQV